MTGDLRYTHGTEAMVAHIIIVEDDEDIPIDDHVQRRSDDYCQLFLGDR